MKILRQSVVSDGASPAPGESHSCFPVLTQLKDDTLVLVTRLGSNKESADGKLRIRHSRDNGKTWQRCEKELREPVNGTPAEYRAGGITHCANGDLFFSCGWLDRTDPSLPIFNPVTEGLVPIHLCAAHSQKGLEEFGALQKMDASPKIQAAFTGPALRLKDGALLQGFETNKTYDDPKPWHHESCVIRSDDHGMSWEPPAVIGHDPAGRLFFWDQRNAQLANGRVVALFWTYDREKKMEVPIHAGWSQDGGRTWSQPKSTGIEGQVASPIALADGRLVAVWVRRHAPPSIRLAISKDGGSWGEEFTVYDHRAKNVGPGDGQSGTGDYLQTMQLWNFGLPGGVQLSNGNLLISFYAPAEKGTCIRVAEVEV